MSLAVVDHLISGTVRMQTAPSFFEMIVEPNSSVFRLTLRIAIRTEPDYRVGWSRMQITESYQFAARFAGEKFSCAQYYTGAKPRLNGVHKEY
jgi:hypothetical protein